MLCEWKCLPDPSNFQVWDAKEQTKNVQGIVVQPGSECCLGKDSETIIRLPSV